MSAYEAKIVYVVLRRDDAVCERELVECAGVFPGEAGAREAAKMIAKRQTDEDARAEVIPFELGRMSEFDEDFQERIKQTLPIAIYRRVVSIGCEVPT